MTDQGDAGRVRRRGILRRAAAGLALAAGGGLAAAASRDGEAAPALAATFGDVLSGSGPFALRLVNRSSAAGVSGLRAEIGGTPGADAAAVRGTIGGANATTSGISGVHTGKGAGVRGSAPSGLAGVYGASKSGRGVFGETATGDGGVFGRTANPGGSGVRGEADGANAAGVFGLNGSGAGVWGRTLSPDASGVYGESEGRGVYGRGWGPDGYGVLGTSEQRDGVVGTTSASDGSGVRGQASGDGAAGVFGLNTSGPGVWGRSQKGNGVFAESTSGSAVLGRGKAGVGVHGTSSQTHGVQGEATATGAAGVFGEALVATATGVFGRNYSSGVGVKGYSNSGIGVVGDSLYGDGVTGRTHVGNGSGVRGEADGANAAGVFGVNTQGAGVWGRTTSTGASGVYGESPYRGVYGTGVKGVWGHADGTTTNHIGVLGTAAGGSAWAGWFDGKVKATNGYSGATVTTVIDHPLDPANKYLGHAAVGSPEMKNVYDGVVITDSQGRASVKLPGYVEALNRDFRYQLTVIGTAAHAYISREVDNNSFEVRTDQPRTKVSWLLTGVRKDRYALSHGLIVEEAKTGTERGRYLHPEEHGQPASMAISPQQPPGREVEAPAERAGSAED